MMNRYTLPAYLQLPSLLNLPDIFHGCFNRHGGVSTFPHDTLNVSYGTDDLPEHIKKNRQHIKKRLNIQKLVSCRQVHGDHVYIVDHLPGDDFEVNGYDALITNQRGIAMMIQQADCQAVLLADPVNKAVGICHAGWRGSVENIVATTIEKMTQAYNTAPSELRAGISPSLGPCCAEFIHYHKELPSFFHGFQKRKNHFDFWEISHQQLIDAGIQATNISTAAICTKCNTDYFSYRRDGVTGRCASIIGIY